MKIILFFCVGLWLLAIVAGMSSVLRYENTPAETAVLYPVFFPEESHIDRNSELPTIIFFAHPKCPCTRASLRELSRLMSDVDGKLSVNLVFSKPEGEDDEWTNTDLRKLAEEIPNVKIIIDENERETNLFNAQTSGTVLLYDQEGKLRFDGGITAARGHEGDNPGRNAIFKILIEKQKENTETFVFGCPLHDKNCQGTFIQHEQQ